MYYVFDRVALLSCHFCESEMLYIEDIEVEIALTPPSRLYFPVCTQVDFRRIEST